MLTGCFKITGETVFEVNNRVTNKSKIPASNGSVGRNISMGKPGTNSESGMERGTKKTSASKSLSNEKNNAKPSNNANGERANR